MRRAARRARHRPPGQHRARRRGRARRPRPAGHRRPRASRCSRSGSARTPGSRSSATSSGAARRARSTATSAPCSATRPSASCSTRPTTSRSSIGIRGHRVCTSPLMECVAQTRSIAGLIADRRLRRARWRCAAAASPSRTSCCARSCRPARASSTAGQRALRLAVLHAGEPGARDEHGRPRRRCASAMDRGHTAARPSRDGFRGLLDGRVDELEWMSVSGWVSRPGAELGTNRLRARPPRRPARIADQLAAHRVDGLLMIGGWAGYHGAHA